MASANDRLLGQVLDGVYRLDSVIGTGSSSIVYRASHFGGGPPVAIKVLYGSFTTDDGLMRRYAQLVERMAGLDHPHIVKVHGFFEEAGIHAVVMDLVDGLGLDRLLYELAGPMAPRRIGRILAPVLDALEYAHGRGQLHRDLKPANVLVEGVEGDERPRVTDFGAAEVLAQAAGPTSHGAVLGTLLYMSPEQCKAHRQVDVRSDLYTLGATLYHMAVGMVPFYADSALEIMLAHVQTDPTPPCELEPSVPRELERVILKALEKDPDQRFQNVGEMKEAVLGATDVSREHAARPPSPRRDEPSERAPDPGLRADRPTGPQPRDVPTAAPGSSTLDLGTRPEHLRQPGTPPPGPAAKVALESPSGVGVYGFTRPRRRRPSGPAAARPSARGLRPEPRPEAPAIRRSANGHRGPGAEARRPAAPAPPSQPLGWWEEHTWEKLTRLRLRVPQRGEWSRFFDPNVAGGGIFCPTSSPPDVGTPVRVEITFIGGPRCFVRGLVTWRRMSRQDPRARPGAGVQVHPGERDKLLYLNHWAVGQARNKRGLRRLPLRLRVTYSARAGRRINFTRDLNEEGIFVRSRELLEPSTPIKLLLMPPGPHKPYRLAGTVSRTVGEGDDRGMGISLHFADETERDRYSRFVERLEEEFLTGALPEEVIA